MSYKYKFSKYKNKLQNMIGGGLCIICGRPANITYLPCTHNNMCRICLENKLKSHRDNNNETPSCDICRKNIEQINILNDADSVENIDNDTYAGHSLDINTEDPLNKFIFSLLKEDDYFGGIDNIMRYVSEKITSLDTRILNDLREYISLLIEKERLKENSQEEFIRVIQDQNSGLNIRLNNYIPLIHHMNSAFRQELLANIYNTNSSRAVDPANLEKKDTIDALNLSIDDILQNLRDPRGRGDNLDRDNILRIFDYRPDSRSIDVSDTQKLDEAISELTNLYTQTQHANSMIELYYRMYYGRLPRLDNDTLQQLFDSTNYFVLLSLQNAINKERDSNRVEILRSQMETYQNMIPFIIQDEIFEAMRYQIYPFIVELVKKL